MRNPLAQAYVQQDSCKKTGRIPYDLGLRSSLIHIFVFQTKSATSIVARAAKIVVAGCVRTKTSSKPCFGGVGY